MDKPLVFTDFHHAGLLNSLILLFEGRIGGAVFRPIGHEWYARGYWAVYDHPATREQYLGIGGNTPDGTPKLNEIERFELNSATPGEPGVYYCHDIDSGFTNKAITFAEFMAQPFDIVIATIPQHIEPFKKLCEAHPNKPKLIYQIGNAWVVEAGLAPNIMASAKISNIPEGINFVEYHQEFDLNIFQPDKWTIQYGVLTENGATPTGEPKDIFMVPEKNIYSFVNVFQEFPDFKLFEEIERRMPLWNFKSFGGQCRDGAAHGAQEVAKLMKESKFVWHTKAGGDGYGHVVHNIPAVGRPMIVKREYYEGKLAADLMIDGVTCLVIDNLTHEEIVNKIEHYSQSDEYQKLCRGAYENFKKVVDFERDANKVREFLNRLM